MRKIIIFLKKVLKSVFLWVFLVTVFSLVVLPGYNVFVSDHSIYLPAIYHKIDSGLFKNDILSSFNQSTFTIFDEVVVAVVKVFDGNIVRALLFLIIFFRAVFIFSVFRITFFLSKNQWLGWLAVFLTLPGFIVYGTVSSTFDVFLTPRLMATALGLLCLVGIIEKKNWLAAVSLFGSGFFHPLTAFVFGVIFYFSLFINCNLSVGKKRLLSLMPVISILILILAVYFFWPGILIVMDKVWSEIIKDRNPSVFISIWPKEYASALIYLLVSALIFLIAKVELEEVLADKKRKEIFNLLFWIPAFLFCSSFIFVDLFQLSFFAQFQLARALLIWKIFTPIWMLLLVNKFLQIKTNNFFWVFSLLGILTSFIFKESLVFIFFPSFFVFWLKRRYPTVKQLSFKGLKTIMVALFVLLVGVLLWWWKQHNYLDNILKLAITLFITGFLTLFYLFNYPLSVFKRIFLAVVILIFIFKIGSFSFIPVCQRNLADIELQRWIKDNTTKDSLFLTEPFTSQDESSTLRLCALRSVFFSRKDGAQVVYNRDYAVEWQKRRELIGKLGEHPEELSEFSKLYKIDYVLSLKKISGNLPFIFNNDKYFVYLPR